MSISIGAARFFPRSFVRWYKITFRLYKNTTAITCNHRRVRDLSLVSCFSAVVGFDFFRFFSIITTIFYWYRFFFYIFITRSPVITYYNTLVFLLYRYPSIRDH